MMKKRYEAVDVVLLIIIVIFLSLIFYYILVDTAKDNKDLVTNTTTSSLEIITVVNTTSLPTLSTTISSTTTTITSTTSLSYCTSSKDCGEEYYYGTYFCDDYGNVALLRYKPTCKEGVCKLKAEIQTIDVCRKNESCIYGFKRCLLENESLVPDDSRILKLNNVTFAEAFGYGFRVNFVGYEPYYEVSAVMLDVRKPDGLESTVVCGWETEGIIDDFRIGLYFVTKSSIVIWVKKV